MPRSNRISVVIPHLNQPDSLERCLASLRAQSGTFTLGEIIVVDNGSQKIPETVCSDHGATLIKEDTPGPGPARNTGVVRATGDILAFIDADCTAHPDWLAVITQAFSQNAAATLLGGDVRIPRRHADNVTLLEAYESIYAYRMKEYIAKQGFTGTGNLAARHSVIGEVGPFGGIDIAEDRDWGQRALAKGHETRYVPEMIVYHPARKNFRELTQKWDRHIAHDFEAIATKSFRRLRWLTRAIAIAGSPLFEVPRILRSDRVRGMRERGLAFVCLIRIRLYRAWRMIGLLFSDRSQAMSGSWNRD